MTPLNKEDFVERKSSYISHLYVYLVAGITSLLQFLFCTIAMILSLCYINFLSQDVTDNLQELAEHISEAQITDENCCSLVIATASQESYCLIVPGLPYVSLECLVPYCNLSDEFSQYHNDYLVML